MIIKANKNNISKIITFIDHELSKYKIAKKEKIKALFSAEEAIDNLINNASANVDISLNVRKFFGSYNIRITCEGSKIDLASINKKKYKLDNLTNEESAVLDEMVEKLCDSNVSYKRNKDTNICIIKVAKSKYRNLYLTLSGLVLGIICGLTLKYVPTEISLAITKNFFEPVYIMFINALKFIVAPLVFLSIAESIAGFSSLAALGRIASKVLALFLITSAIAVCVGLASSLIFPIGDSSLQDLISDAGSAAIANGSEVSFSLKNMIVGIIPSDIINPFLKMDMLQVIFVAILIGTATSFVGNESTFAKFIKSANEVVSQVVSLVIKFLPLAVFCSMSKMMVEMDFVQLGKVMVWVPACYVGHLLMLVVNAILLLLLAKYNPITFYKKFVPAIVTAFSTSSSNATLPITIRQCRDALKISPKVYSFSLPMGATVNMNGSCITLIVSAMFAMHIFGVDLSASVFFAAFITIISLAMGCPGIPGSSIVCCTVLMPVVGVPAEFISLIMALDPLVDMIATVTNITGDAVTTTIVAKSENLIEVS